VGQSRGHISRVEMLNTKGGVQKLQVRVSRKAVRKGPKLGIEKRKGGQVGNCRLVLVVVTRELEDGSVHTLGRLVSRVTMLASLKRGWSQGA
jgi:hypothetical protein